MFTRESCQKKPESINVFSKASGWYWQGWHHSDQHCRSYNMLAAVTLVYCKYKLLSCTSQHICPFTTLNTSPCSGCGGRVWLQAGQGLHHVPGTGAGRLRGVGCPDQPQPHQWAPPGAQWRPAHPLHQRGSVLGNLGQKGVKGMIMTMNGGGVGDGDVGKDYHHCYVILRNQSGEVEMVSHNSR